MKTTEQKIKKEINSLKIMKKLFPKNKASYQKLINKLQKLL